MKILTSKMRDIQQLLKSSAGCERISDYNFRSPEEVLTYVDGLSKQVNATVANLTKLAKFKQTASQRIDPIQDIDHGKLADCYQQLTDLQQKLEILQSLEVTVSHNFRSNRTDLVKSIRALTQRITVQRDKALGQLEKMARDREPEKFQKIVAKVVQVLEKRFKKKFKSFKQYAYITSGKEPSSILFNHFIEFADLLNDHQEYVYHEYYVVVSAAITDKGLMRTYVNSLHEFRAPGTFSIGQEFESEKDVQQVLDAILLADEFIDQSDLTPIKIKINDVRKKLETKNVENVEVLDNKVRVRTGELEPDQLEKAVKTLIRDVTAILLPHGIKGALKYKASKIGRSNKYNVDFVVVPQQDKIGLDAQHEQLLRTRLGMNDDQIVAVRKLLSKGHV